MAELKFSIDQELDIGWFALDRSGVIALFLTSGGGFYPEDLDQDDATLDQIFELVPTPRWGSIDVWKDYGAAGLFVYDWTGAHYELVQVPSNMPTAELNDLIHSLTSLPTFAANFEPGDRISAQTALLAT